ncbi:hypothetical protein JCM3775_005171 [Rhodotorula graminis]|uniref:Amino acid permease/ SLC12A domain-containing protein n=1 Tax=Rhodotorula graminis (strain WP1) TaxID=578459 RepID=A0A0P9EKN1_RHOGW|nr:uncharacterized protein RHOBADRAFT_39685 [Rhodotorula graminis WP1]KPV72244.1 hypothetical protein RHOBADRAFT_39685 [Rhodotorula graminis WP1]
MSTSLDLEKAHSPSAGSQGGPDDDKEVAPSEALPTDVVSPEHLTRALSARQVSMIAIGGTIGTGLFLGTGRSLVNGGPASLLINYSIVGALVYLVMLCLGEMATEFPLAGSFTTYAARFGDPALGFTIGWNYAFNDAVSTAGDLTAAQVLIGYWTPKYNWLPSLLFLFFVVTVNLVHVRAYGELEYWLSLLKIVAIVIFFFLGIAVNAGGNVDGEYIGARNWTVGEAPFVNGFAGFASLFVNAAFAYGGTESIGITAGETRNPARNMPKVVRNVFWRIIIFYLSTVIIIGFNIPYNYPNLSTKSTQTSPFTLVFQMAGAKAGGSFMNAVVLTSVVSAANHALFAGARVLYGLAVIRQAPAVFRKTNAQGVPWVSVLAIASVSLILFGASFLPGGASQIFSWCQNLVGVSNQLAWLTIGITSTRFRWAWAAQGRSASELRFPNPAGKWAGPVVVVVTSFIILVQGWSVFRPPFDAVGLVANYIELPIFVALYLVFRLAKWGKVRTPSLKEIDLDTGRYVNTAEDDKDDEDRAARESGRLGWAWKAWGWIA